MEVECFLINDWDRLKESRCDSWRDLKLALLQALQMFTPNSTVGVNALPFGRYCSLVSCPTL